MYLCTWRGFFLPKRETLFLFFFRFLADMGSSIYSRITNINTYKRGKKNQTSPRLLLSGKSHIENVHVRKAKKALLRYLLGGILFRLVAVLLVKAKEKVKIQVKEKRFDA